MPTYLRYFSVICWPGPSGKKIVYFIPIFWGPKFLQQKDALQNRGEFRSFEKGLADRGGWREETLQRPEIQASFLYPSSYAPLGERGHISGELFWALFGGLFVANSLPPTPFRNLEPFLGQFSHFSAIFPPFARWGQIHFSAIFSISGRRPDLGSRAIGIASVIAIFQSGAVETGVKSGLKKAHKP